MLLLADIDGTLMANVPELGADVVTLANYVRASGGALMPVSARPVDDIARLFAGVVNVRLGAGSGGGVIAEMAGGLITSVRHETTFDLSPHRNLIGALERTSHTRRGAIFCFTPMSNGFRVLVDVGSSGLDPEQLAHIAGARPLERVQQMLHTAPGHARALLGVSLLAQSDTPTLVADLSRLGLPPEIRMTSYPEVRVPGWSWVELFPRLANKADAARRIVAASLETGNRREVVAIGDAVDDIGMFEMADTSYCPSDAEEAVRLAASVTLPAPGGAPFVQALLADLMETRGHVPRVVV